MASTTNYSWSTPDDTALVKDGAAAIRSLGSAIDSTVFTNAGAAINKTIVDAKGDIIAATAADTVSRLAVGANDTVLIADSSTATGLKWGTVAGGGMTVIASGSLSGTEVSLTSIPGTYNNLQLVIRNWFNSGGNDLAFRFNTNTGSVYSDCRIQSANTSFSSQAISNQTSLITNVYIGTVNENNIAILDLPDYASSSFKVANTTIRADNTGGTYICSNAFGVFKSTSAISSIQIRTSGGTATLSGTYVLYGVK